MIIWSIQRGSPHKIEDQLDILFLFKIYFLLKFGGFSNVAYIVNFVNIFEDLASNKK